MARLDRRGRWPGPRDRRRSGRDWPESRAETFGATEDYLVTREFKAISTMDERERLLRCCLLVMAADDEVDATESWLANRLAEELDVERADLNRIRDEFHDRLAGVRSSARCARASPGLTATQPLYGSVATRIEPLGGRGASRRRVRGRAAGRVSAASAARPRWRGGGRLRPGSRPARSSRHPRRRSMTPSPTRRRTSATSSES